MTKYDPWYRILKATGFSPRLAISTSVTKYDPWYRILKVPDPAAHDTPLLQVAKYDPWYRILKVITRMEEIICNEQEGATCVAPLQLIKPVFQNAVDSEHPIIDEFIKR